MDLKQHLRRILPAALPAALTLVSDLARAAEARADLPALLGPAQVERGAEGPLDVPVPPRADPPTAPTEVPTEVPTLAAPAARASPPDARPTRAAVDRLAKIREQITLRGYAEIYYQYNWNRPSNGLTNYRAFDNRHNAITVQNTALDAMWRGYGLELRLALQVGHAPETYYGTSEPPQAGATGVAPSSPTVFKNLQQVYGLWHPDKKQRWAVAAGIFLSPIGPESLAVSGNWYWSHSNLFFGLPFYHSGLRLRFAPTAAHGIEAGVVNGWNNVVDNNREKTIFLQYNYARGDRLSLGALYFTGVERPKGAPEGRAWRHLWDLWVVAALHRRVSVLAEVDAGIEPNRFGLSWWFAAMGGVRLKLADWAYLAGRGTYFRDDAARSAAGAAAPIALPAPWIAAVTGTFDVRLVGHLSIKLELRHDRAGAPLYFRGAVMGDGSDASPFKPNAATQTTTTLGFNAFF